MQAIKKVQHTAGQSCHKTQGGRNPRHPGPLRYVGDDDYDGGGGDDDDFDGCGGDDDFVDGGGDDDDRWHNRWSVCFA